MKIAVIGSGISGLGAAYALSRGHDVELFERDGRAGGHSNTVEHMVVGRTLGLDTGFIVHNEDTYPSLVRLFRELGVRTQPSEMSFSVACERHGLEYSGRRPPLRRLTLEIARFLRRGRLVLDDPRYTDWSLSRYVAEEGYSPQFRDHFLVPLCAALWSTAPSQTLDFPLVYAVRFFANHGLLGFRRLQWRTVAGGSQTYVRALEERLRINLSTEVRSIRRLDDGIELRLAGDVPRASTASSSRPTRTRLFACSRIRARTSVGCSASSGRPRTTPSSTPTSDSCPEASDPLLLELPASRLRLRRRPADDDLLPEQAPAPRRGRALLRHAQPHGRDRPGEDHPPVLLPPPARDPGVDARAARAAAPERPAAHRLRRRVAGVLLPRGRAALRPRRRRRLRSGAGEVRALHRHRDAREEDAEGERLPLPGLLLPARPRRAARLDRRVRLFGWNRRDVVSLHDRDHLDIRAYLAEHGIEADRILL